MRYRILTPAIATVLFAVLLVFADDGSGASRTEVELSWDDGSAEDGFSALAGRKLAVGFQAPESATELRGIQIYVVDDGLENPEFPGEPTTRECTIWVWKDAAGSPGAAVSYGQFVEPGYPEEAWLEVMLDEPVDLSNAAHFPEHRFHVGLEWESRTNPVIGLDLDSPLSGETRLWDWTSWSVVDTANAMVRAVVYDSTAVPVEVQSWGRVKSSFR